MRKFQRAAVVAAVVAGLSTFGISASFAGDNGDAPQLTAVANSQANAVANWSAPAGRSMEDEGGKSDEGGRSEDGGKSEEHGRSDEGGRSEDGGKSEEHGSEYGSKSEDGAKYADIVYGQFIAPFFSSLAR